MVPYPDVETHRCTSLPRDEFHATDFIHYIFTCGNTAITQRIRIPGATYIICIIGVGVEASSSQQGM